MTISAYMPEFEAQWTAHRPQIPRTPRALLTMDRLFPERAPKPSPPPFLAPDRGGGKLRINARCAAEYHRMLARDAQDPWIKHHFNRCADLYEELAQ